MNNYTFKNITPCLRILDEYKAREFYIDFLGFSIVFEHRFSQNFPLYLGLIIEDLILHLSEHYDYCSIGSCVRIEVENLDLLHKELKNKDYKYCKPSIEKTEWGTLEINIKDPFNNRLVFYKNTN